MIDGIMIFLKWLWWMILGLVVLAAALIIVLPVLDWISPPRQIVERIEKEVPHGFRILVGKASGKTIYNEMVTSEYSTRNYILIPNVFSDPSTYRYTKILHEEPSLRRMPYGAFKVIIADILIILFAAWILRRYIPKLRNTEQVAAGNPPG
jgi:hypothetical protein